MMRIGAVANTHEVTADTLRYYERLGLLGAVPRDAGGRRDYGPRQIARLQFVRRAQQCGFSLAEIGTLVRARDDAQPDRRTIRDLARRKLTEIRARRLDLDRLDAELELMVNLCGSTDEGCPILERLDADLPD